MAATTIHRSQMNPFVLAAAALGLLLAGCGEGEQIRSYKVLKPDALARAAGSGRTAAEGGERMLAAIVPRDEKMWFFKLTGSDEPVASQTDEFLSFIKSIRFTEGEAAEPNWDLPSGWSKTDAGRGDEMFPRFATVEIPTDGQTLEMSVTSLPTIGDADEFVLQNVNRWRRQMGLSAIRRDELLAAAGTADGGELGETARLLVDEGTATLVNLQGTLDSSPMGRAPFAGGANRPRPMPRPTPAATEPQFRYDVPEGWSESSGSGLSVASFKAEQDGKAVEITVTPLSAAAGDLVGNVNRWRGQIQLEPQSPEQLQEETAAIEVDGSEASYVKLVAPESADPREAILGVIAVRGERAWFFKLRGAADLALEQQENFERFVKSFDFGNEESAGNGN